MGNKNVVSKVLIIIGVLFVGYSLVLFIQNERIELNAKTYSEIAVEEILKEIETYENEQLEENVIVFDNQFSYEDFSGEITSEYDSYIGILSIPCLNLELAIQSDWSYEKLANTPCVYQEEPMSIAGHNYTAHFGKLSNLEIGDIVIFTDTTGEEFIFKVVSNTIISEADIEKLQDENYDLTLFTCNYSNDSERVLIRLNLI